MPRLIYGLFLFRLFVSGGAVPELSQAAQTPSPTGNLTIEEVVKLSQNGFSEDLIVTRIKKNGKAFDLSTDELLELKKVGVSDRIVKYLLDPSQPYAGPPPPAPSASPPADPPPPPGSPPKQYPADTLASKVPPEPGLYLFVGEAPVKVDLKLLLGVKEGAGLGKVVMSKGKMIAFLPGAASKTRVNEGPLAFYIRLPEGKQIEEVALITFKCKSNRREVEMGPPGPKQEFKAGVIHPFETVEVGGRLFKINPGKLPPAEYVFFLIGSAEPAKGSQGKGYDFGVDALKTGR